MLEAKAAILPKAIFGNILSLLGFATILSIFRRKIFFILLKEPMGFLFP